MITPTDNAPMSDAIRRDHVHAHAFRWARWEGQSHEVAGHYANHYAAMTAGMAWGTLPAHTQYLPKWLAGAGTLILGAMTEGDVALLRVWHLMALLDNPENNDDQLRAGWLDEMFELADEHGGMVADQVAAYR